jgi:hypothetical protein
MSHRRRSCPSVAQEIPGRCHDVFVVEGTVVNQPSDVAVRRRGEETIRLVAEPGDKVFGHVERPVASALTVVPSNQVAAPPVDPLAGPSLDLPEALALPAVSSTDPGSVPGGGLPALVTEAAHDLANVVRVGAVAANVVVAVALVAFVVKRHNGTPTAVSGRPTSRHRPDRPAGTS